ncbi:Gfo/Idh/MocA family oxidoreductase [Muricauda sp. JGD-17]|uniref:Gfo/Idh/MocA family oxidoreductase n=1 Tax=Flagellimonas ochracea TaxID=2696472 RepID=A0A964TBU6_9FLAO|nr:Gfo/Idh/MocA family oxidoreductase [Allomuricauda ochracea]NAY91982.1 Gfo/Idh/MocA family oxidoreductase [Allomuricauda ochracea]
MESPLSFSGINPLRWGVIGCGSVAEKKSVPAYQITSGFEVRMVMRRNAKKAQDYARRHNVPNWTANAKEVIENPEIDAVYIATPPDSHKLYALQVAAKGKPCCIEKPMAPSFKDSLEIFEAFQKRDIPLFISYYRRSLPRFLKIKQWLKERQIGDVEHIHWKKTKPPNEVDFSGKYNWRTDGQVAMGGYFDDLASHGLDLFIFLLGDIIEAHGEATNQLGLYTAFDLVSGSWKHKNGIMGKGVWDFTSNDRSDEVEILGAKGRISFSVLDEAPISLENHSGIKKLDIPNPEHIQQYHVENIKSHLSGFKPHPSIGKTGLHTSWVMDKILGRI